MSATANVAKAELTDLMAELSAHIQAHHWTKTEEVAKAIGGVAKFMQFTSVNRELMVSRARRLGISLISIDEASDHPFGCGDDCTHPSHRAGGMKPAGWQP